MKKLLLFLVALIATSTAFAQAVQRNKVIIEVSTGTWCTYCPGAAIAADDMVSNGHQVAVIEYHNGDAFANTASNARNTYYNISGYPTAHFDGPTPYVGGVACPGGGLYPTYLSNYNTAYAVQSPLTIDLSGTSSGNDYTVVLSIHKVAAVSGTDLRAMLVLTESGISTSNWPGSSGCMNSVQFVERLMAPDYNGTSFSFTSGDMQIFVLNFTKDASWVAANCELVAFVQDYGTKTIYNGVKVALNALPLPVPVNFSSNTTSGCSPLTVNYTDQSTGVNTYQWAFPGGTPSSSTVQNPSVSYSATGAYDATLTAWSTTTWRGNKVLKPAYINVTSVPGAAAAPTGATQLCTNPANQTYTTSGVSGATNYLWDLQPPAAGVITPSGNTCTVDFDNAYSGSVTLKVKGTNTCGDGPWSTPLSITLSPPPTAPGTPTGQALLCINPPNTDYQTSGASLASSYTWDLSPFPTAGTISGTSTTGIVDWSFTYTGAAQVKVKGINNGCEGPWSASLTVNVENVPIPYSMTGGGVYCAVGGTGVEVGLSGSQAGVNYTLYLEGGPTAVVVPGTGAPISFGNQLLGGNYSAQANNLATTCSSMMNGTALINVDPQVPDAPAQPTGTGNPAPGSTSDYSTTGGTYATTYSWAVTPPEAGNISGSGTTGSITWSSSYLGSATIKVQGINSCGAGSYSVEFPVNVVTGISALTMEKMVTVYPNPAKEIINIVPSYKMKTDLKVFNSLGDLVIEKNNIELNGTYPLDISNLTPGIYYLNVMHDNAKQIQKVIVQ